MKKTGPLCERCGVMVLPRDAAIERVNGVLTWVHKDPSECNAHG